MRFTSFNSALDLLTFSCVLLSKPVDPMNFNEQIQGVNLQILDQMGSLPFFNTLNFSCLYAISFFINTDTRISDIFAALKNRHDSNQKYRDYRARRSR